MPRTSLTGVVAGLLILALGGVVRVAARQGSAPPAADPQVASALQRGEAALRARQYEVALDAFTTANTKQNKTSALALYGMSRAFHGLNAWKSEADACTDALRYVGTDKTLEAQLHNQRGLAYVQLAQKPTDKALRDAESEFRSVLVLTDSMPTAWFNLGVALLRQSRDPEGLAALQAFVDSGASMPDVDTAKKMIENPRRARESYAPDFAVASLEGEYVSLKDLQGKVVLLDFWGTWCGPCVQAAPMLTEIARARAKDPRFQIIGISSDSAADAGKLRGFLLAHKMTWPEIHDTAHKVIAPYGVHEYPTYIVIDAEGIVRARLHGYSPSSTRGALDDAIGKALKAIPK